jgi:peptidoglycan-associated lipoprotein
MTRRKPSPQLVRLAFTAAIALSACGGPTYPNCENDGHCHEGEFCVNGRCQQCRPDSSDCPSGQDCVQGRCEQPEGYCDGAGDCPNGQECRNNRCVLSSLTTSDPENLNGGACQLASVQFEYDSSDLDESARSTLQSNATCIQQREIPNVNLVGHCDMRGTEEYNLALGDRRARGVASYLQNLGVDQSRLTTSSMGEEMASGEDEASMARDRRVEFRER